MLYCLYHDNIISKDGLPEYVSRKIIGHFDSMEKALAIMEKYKGITGFEEFPHGFGMEIVFQKDFGDATGIVYRIAYVDYNKVDGPEIYFDGYYVSLAQAKATQQKIMSLPRFNNVLDNIDTYEICVNREQWGDGFVTE